MGSDDYFMRERKTSDALYDQGIRYHGSRVSIVLGGDNLDPQPQCLGHPLRASRDSFQGSSTFIFQLIGLGSCVLKAESFSERTSAFFRRSRYKNTESQSPLKTSDNSEKTSRATLFEHVLLIYPSTLKGL
jgi:hypothetical protein